MKDVTVKISKLETISFNHRILSFFSFKLKICLPNLIRLSLRFFECFLAYFLAKKIRFKTHKRIKKKEKHKTKKPAKISKKIKAKHKAKKPARISK